MTFAFEVWPTEAPRVITQPFGVNPAYYSRFDLPGHDGVDLRAPHGSRIFAVAPGTVIRAHTNPNNHNYGIHAYIKHANGFITGYGHLAELHVRQDQAVAAGDVIGTADNTGNSFGSHLHLLLKREGVTYEDWPYNIMDPTPYLLPLMGWQRPAGELVRGWMHEAVLDVQGDLAQVAADGASFWRRQGEEAIQVPGGTIVVYLGQTSGYFTLVEVARASIGLDQEVVEPPDPVELPQPTVATVDGWARKAFLFEVGNRAVVRRQGVSLRAEPELASANIGLLKSGSTVELLGEHDEQFAHVRAQQEDFAGPIKIPETPVEWPAPAPAAYLGWLQTASLEPADAATFVVSKRFGANFYAAPDRQSTLLGLVKGFATVTVAGRNEGGFTPVSVRGDDFVLINYPIDKIQTPQPLPGGGPVETPEPPQETTPGWVFSADLTADGPDSATVGQLGVILRAAPQRNAAVLGYIPAGMTVLITDKAQGEYTPVRVNDDRLLAQDAAVADEPVIAGTCRFGLHASADPPITPAEIALFDQVAPRLIKVLSSNDPTAVRRLAQQHTGAHWVVRAFLDFGGRNITPGQFFRDTISDVERALDILEGRPLVVELHNEPNIRMEGWGTSWNDGREFAAWWLELLDRYRDALPRTRFIYPGLSPGGSMVIRQDHVQFLEASREAVQAADGMGVHVYWSHYHTPAQALETIDDIANRFRGIPLWITEAGNGSAQVASLQKGHEYVDFWRSLRSRPIVQGIAYWVASGSNPEFAPYVWLGTDIGRIVSLR